MPAAKIIASLKKQLGLNEDFLVMEKVWEKEVGIYDIKMDGFKNGIILACTHSSVAGNELIIRKREILKKMNQYFNSQKIKDIKVKIKQS
jgi:hypothetical protein